MTSKRLFIGAGVVALVLSVSPTWAQGQRTADEINSLINELDRRPADTPAYRQNVKSRTLHVRPDIAHQDIYLTNAAIKEIPVVLNYNHTKDFTINFRFDSFQLTRQARDTLDILGEALSSEQLRDDLFLVGGHTDTVGKDDYNQWLSERRAYEVTAYLIDVWKISPDRLQPVGFGETELKDPRAGANKINRRVEFTVIEPESSAPVASGGASYDATPSAQTAAVPVQPAPAQQYAPVQPVAPQYVPQQNSTNVVCDTRTGQLSDPRPNQQGLDDFRAGRTPAECLDAQPQYGQAPVPPQRNEAIGLGGTNSAIDDVNNAIGN
ncbi:OmpA family protein [Acuticoccus sediminis]|uniref:OmpA family protein n=1 Tax=Acuticoccus sediminis TaxID=2184697 RepID=UPI001391C9F6|nr:OmpA family protein [Acuticoccus sediminis]